VLAVVELNFEKGVGLLVDDDALRRYEIFCCQLVSPSVCVSCAGTITRAIADCHRGIANSGVLISRVRSLGIGSVPQRGSVGLARCSRCLGGNTDPTLPRCGTDPIPRDSFQIRTPPLPIADCRFVGRSQAPRESTETALIQNRQSAIF
jgi:hypothetical protein